MLENAGACNFCLVGVFRVELVTVSFFRGRVQYCTREVLCAVSGALVFGDRKAEGLAEQVALSRHAYMSL